ncbi:hypothetical protein M378DRAFT_19228 [Amanita muscaria Koide BX008]|uniref:Uncharacterized protein n=1 Tax=Amanita muscaria (strain Koide BX008) TaxID=946122 RepID=A0A0C2VZ21_AMAMK|nr:hypothetical protein M378DRAFT_19228 [Amanita muscaria Koide BX008]
MSSPTIPSYVFPDTCSPSPILSVPTPITLPVIAPLPVSAHYIPINNEVIPYWSDEEGVTTCFSTPEYYPPIGSPTPEYQYQPPRPLSVSNTSPRWTPSSPPAPTITPPPETPGPLVTPELSFTPVIPPGPFNLGAIIIPTSLHRARSEAFKSIYEHLLLSNGVTAYDAGVSFTLAGLANIDPNRPPNCTQRVRHGQNSFLYLLDRRPIRFDNKAWRYNSDSQPVSEDEFWTPQTRGRPPNDSVEHNQKFYWQKQELYFDQSTDRWRTEDGNHPAPDEFFEGKYTPGNPDEHVPEELRTPPTPVAGPSNPEPTKKETLQEHQKNSLTQISQQN